MKVELDGRLMTDRTALHDLLSSALEFPSYYGRNLDALYDLLTEGRKRLEIDVIHVAELRAALGEYGNSFLSVLEDAASENPELCVRFFDKFSDNEK